MKKIMGFVLVSLFFVTFCGAPEEAKTETMSEKTGKEIGYQTLTEKELENFIKVFPVFKTEIEKHEEEWEEIEAGEDFGSWIQQFSQANKAIAGLDAKLSAAGMPWEDFWPAFAKTTTAIVATMFDSAMVEMKAGMKEQEGEIAELEAKLEDPNVSEQEKEMIETSLEMMKNVQKSFEESKKMYEDVPQVNKDLVKKYWTQLTQIFEMEEE